MFQDLDPILCNITGWYCRLLVNPAAAVQHIYNPIARVDTRKFQCITEQLGCLQTSQKRRGNDVMDILRYGEEVNKNFNFSFISIEN